MKHSLPIFALIGLACTGATVEMAWSQEPPAPALSPGELLVHRAAERLDQYSWISARFRLKAELFGQHILGNGEYRQAPAATHRLRCDTKLQVGEHITSLQQVADGQYLWVHRQREGKSSLNRIDLARVLATEQILPHSEGTVTLHGLGLGAIGGLPKLLRNLDLSVRFTSLAQAKLPMRSGQKTFSLPVYVAQGEWKPATLARLVPDQAETIKGGGQPDWDDVPPHVPNRVLVALGRDDWFPYRIEFRRAADDEQQTLFTLELYDVHWNVPLEPRLFTYQPGNIPVNDTTDQFLINLSTQ